MDYAYDAFTGLVDRRARSNYDPANGRFYSADPMGFAAGDANVYRYVGNFATGASDPSGLRGITQGGQVIGGPSAQPPAGPGPGSPITVTAPPPTPAPPPGSPTAGMGSPPSTSGGFYAWWSRHVLEPEMRLLPNWAIDLLSGRESASRPPTFLESMIPVYGPLWQAHWDFEHGNNVSGCFNIVVAAADITLVAGLGVKLGLKGISLGARGVPWLARGGGWALRGVKSAVAKVLPRGQRFFEDLALQATRNPNSTKVVLGKYLQPGKSYTKVAAHLKASYFKLKNWRELAKALTESELWKINEAFLRQQIKQGKQIILSHDPNVATGFFAKEVEFLRSLGYRFVKEGWVWRAER